MAVMTHGAGGKALCIAEWYAWQKFELISDKT